MNIDLKIPIKTLMSKPFQYVSPDDILSDVVPMFKKKKFHHIPVLNSSQKVIGILSNSDYLTLRHPFTHIFGGESQKKNERLFESLTVGDVMTSDPKTIDCDSPLEAALDIFLENQFHALPVVDRHECVGIITPYDILKLIKLTHISI
jgi:CBS domain-containing protein